MKKMILSRLPDIIDRNNLQAISDYLQQQSPQHIDIVNWEKYSYKPEVSFRIMYDNHSFYIRYDVKEKYIRALATEDNGQVWLDSCVEFFLSPQCNDEYYNLEMNCIGTKLLGYHKPGLPTEHASDEILSVIHCRSSLGNLPFDEKRGDFNWNLIAIIPFSVCWKHPIQEVKGTTMKANFYKCGDKLSEPHFLSWNEIQTESPSFHQPGYFGEIIFG